MEVNQQVWLRRESSHWGWVPAVIVRKDLAGEDVFDLTLVNDTSRPEANSGEPDYFRDQEEFTQVVRVEKEQLKSAEHNDIKLRNLPSSFLDFNDNNDVAKSTTITTKTVGGVDDLIGLTHLHEPAILHALRVRYDSDIIYTSTGPILIAVNPFKPMPALYRSETMEEYRIQGENSKKAVSDKSNSPRRSPKKAPKQSSNNSRLSPHVYQTADDAYRQMLHGLDNKKMMQLQKGSRNGKSNGDLESSPSDQSILVSGESGAGKTVTTKIVLDYFAMLSKKRSEDGALSTQSNNNSNDVSIEQQVLQSNPILEAFGNARTIRNDNSSRFGKYIDISFTNKGKLVGASIETYLLEKVRLIHPGPGERNYHVFYQFLKAANASDRQDFFLGSKTCRDFRLLSDSGTFDRRDGVDDCETHHEMFNAMVRCIFLTVLLFCSVLLVLHFAHFAQQLSLFPNSFML